VGDGGILLRVSYLIVFYQLLEVDIALFFL